jgi:hypothetical protein
MEKLPHCNFSWIVSSQKQRQMREDSSGTLELITFAFFINVYSSVLYNQKSTLVKRGCKSWVSKLFMARATPVILGSFAGRTWKDNNKLYIKLLKLL